MCNYCLAFKKITGKTGVALLRLHFAYSEVGHPGTIINNAITAQSAGSNMKHSKINNNL